MTATLHHATDSRQRRLLTIGLALVVTLVAFEALAVATVLPAAQKELGDFALYGWAFSAFLLTSLIGITVAGDECDQHGPARPFVAGVTLFAIGLVIGGLAPTMLVLVAGRAVQGFGAGAIPAVAYAAIGRGYDDSERPRVFALLSSAWVVPSLVGPVVAGALAQYASWRWALLGLLPLLVIASALALPSLRRLGAPAAAKATPDRRRLVQSIQLTAGAAMALGGTTSKSLWCGGALVAVGAAIMLPAWSRLMPAGTLRAARGLPAAILCMGLSNLAFFGTDAFIPLMLAHVRGQSTIVSGMALTAAALSWTTGAWVLERLQTRWSRAAIAGVGFAVTAVGIAGIALVVAEPLPAPAVAASVAWAIAGFGMGLTYSTLSLIVLAEAPEGQQGTASASLKLNEVLCAAIGTGGGGALITLGAARGREGDAMTLLFVTLSVIAIGCAALAPRLSSGGDET